MVTNLDYGVSLVFLIFYFFTNNQSFIIVCDLMTVYLVSLSSVVYKTMSFSCYVMSEMHHYTVFLSHNVQNWHVLTISPVFL